MGALSTCLLCSHYPECICLNCSIEDSLNATIFQPHNSINNIEKLKSHDCKIFTVKTRSNNIIYGALQKPTVILNVIKKCIVFCYGNSCDMLHIINFAKWLADELNICVVIFDYPGYGDSTGNPTEETCYESMESIINYVQKKMNIKKENIFLIGQSLGTGIVIDYAYKHDWNSPIILISPYKSICKVACDSSLVNPIDKFESLKKIKRINCPIKIFHGEDDKLIPIAHAKKLYKKTNNKLYEPIWLSNIGHNDILNALDITEFFEVVNYNEL